jgi:hypothetical protein
MTIGHLYTWRGRGLCLEYQATDRFQLIAQDHLLNSTSE